MQQNNKLNSLCITFSCNLNPRAPFSNWVGTFYPSYKTWEFKIGHISGDIFKICFVNGPKMTKKKLIPPALPTLNMPQKMQTKETVSRPHRSIVQENVIENR